MTRPPITDFMGVNRWLSNFALVDVNLDGIVYPSVEHAYQAAKTADPTFRTLIWLAVTPGEAKKLGQQIKIAPSRWNPKKVQVMDKLLRQKFAQEPFKTQLAMTAGRELIEGNWWGDTFWGVCKGVGENQLGKLIMAIRDGKPPVVEVATEQGGLF